MADSLRAFFDEIENPPRRLALFNRSSPDVVRKLLDGIFDEQVAIDELDIDTDDDDVLALLEDDEIIAKSTMDELLDSILLINSDLFKTGAREFTETELPAVLEGLDEMPFRLRGYPASNKEKLLLIIISRVIERTAYETGSGTLRASFQRLSRLEDEQGTYEVYETLSQTDVDVHVYGIGDWNPRDEMPVTVHTGRTTPYRRSWFVVFRPDDETAEHAALVAIEDEPNVWDGFWTFRPSLVTSIEAHIEANI